MEFFNQIDKKHKLMILVGLLVFLLFVGIIIIVSITNITPRLKIDNIDVVQNLSGDVKDALEIDLYRTVDKNTDEKVPGSGALVRTDTIVSEYNNSTKVYSGNFIVDIDSLKQSYLVQFEWSKEKNNPNLSSTSELISCVREKEKIIYPDFKCEDQFSFNENTDDADIYLNGYLPHIENLSTGETFVVLENGINYLFIQLDSCHNNTLIEEAINKTKAWLNSLGVDPNKFTIQTMKDCGYSHE